MSLRADVPSGPALPYAASVHGPVNAAGELWKGHESFGELFRADDLAPDLRLPTTQARIPAGDRDAPATSATLSVLSALRAEDALAADAATAARDEAMSELLVADAGGQIDLSMIDQLTVGKKDAQWRCLAEALYFEARGERQVGQLAVAEVILNRVDSRRYPDTICAVVRQGMHRKNACQFSYNCDGIRNVISEKRAYEAVGKVAWVMMQGRRRVLTGKATHYHADYVSPTWADALVKTARIGTHLFYRKPTQLSQR